MLTGNNDNFVPVSREEILAGTEKINFDLYSIDLDKGMMEPGILCRRGTSSHDVARVISDRVLDKLFVRKQALQDFYDHMEESLGAIIENPRLPTRKKSDIIYNCASNVMQDVYNDPRSGENIERSREVSNHIIRFTLNDPSSIPTLLSLSSHNYYTFTHCVNVAVFGVGLWQFIGLGSPSELREFALGAILHDVGKSKISDDILNKPGKLTDAEFEVMKSHTTMGAELLAQARLNVDRCAIEAPFSGRVVEEIRARYPGGDAEYAALLEECTRIVVEEVESLRTVVARFREFSRPVELAPEPTDLGQLVLDHRPQARVVAEADTEDDRHALR